MSNTQTTRFDVDTLWVDSVLAGSVEIDWDRESLTYYEAPSCPQCGEYAVWNADEHYWQCPDDGSNCDHVGEIDPFDGGAEGPMMNYFYPLPDLRRMHDDPYAAANAIRDLPLCIVDMNGSYVLALTGGGMDLSWEIVEAYTRLGFLPPFHFVQHLPRFAGMTIDPYVLAACKRTCDVLHGWTTDATERLDGLSA